MRIRILPSLRLWLSLSILLAAPTAWAANTWTVAGTGEPAAASTDTCSTTAFTCPTLREAINHTNAGAGGDTINITATGTITLISSFGALMISKSVNIAGPGASNLTVSGGNAVQVFNIFSGTVVTMSGLTAAYGAALVGGGISNGGTLTLTNSTISNNRANSSGGGIYNGLVNGVAATVTLIDSTISNNSASDFGGGIYNLGTLKLTNSTVSNNTSPGYGYGGGIYSGVNPGLFNAASLTLIGSTISNNSASSFGGGIMNTGTLNLTNSTVSNNTSGSFGGGIDNGKVGNWDVNGGTMVAVNITVSNNTASNGSVSGIHVNGGTTTLTNSIVARGTVTGNACGGFGTFLSGRDSLNDDGTCPITVSANLNLGAPLANNGGPTQTLLPQAGSAAIGRGVPANCPATDQRGVTRPPGAACTSGAVEVRQFTLSASVIGTGKISTGSPSATPSSGSVINNCPGTGGNCAAYYWGEGGSPTPSVTLTATSPAANTSLFWSGTGCMPVPGNPLNVTVTMDQNRSCTATYSQMTLSAAAGTYGTPYSQTLSASGGTAPYTYSFNGSPAPGLSFSGATLSGTPSAVGTYAVMATDANGFTVTTSLKINPASQTLTVTATPSSIVYSGMSTLSTTGGSGTGAVSYNVTSGAAFCSLSGTTLTGTGVGSCTVTATKAADANYNSAMATTSVTVNAATSYTGATANGTGTATMSFSGGGTNCTFTTSQFVGTSTVATPPPVGYSFPQGLFNFTAQNCTVGGTLTVTVTYPQALPPGAVLMKYGPTSTNVVPHWYTYPATISGTTVIYAVTDGGAGDDDLAANGSITDPAGVGVLPPAPAVPAPMLDRWVQLLLVTLFAMIGTAGYTCSYYRE